MITNFKTYYENVFVPKDIKKREEKLSLKKQDVWNRYKGKIEEFKRYIESLNLYKNIEIHWEGLIPILRFASIDLVGPNSPMADHELGKTLQYAIIFGDEIVVVLETNGYDTTIESLEDLKNLLPTPDQYITLLDYVKLGAKKK
jgi:hypothetical protein